MATLQNLNDLLEYQLEDLYSAETQILDALPKVIDIVADPELKIALQNHFDETKNQKKRLEQIAAEMGITIDGHTCKAMKGLVKETSEMIHEDATDEVRDAGLIADAQRVEHYEIAGYGTALAFARRLGLDKVAGLLEKTLNEEKNADAKLTRIAETHVNERIDV